MIDEDGGLEVSEYVRTQMSKAKVVLVRAAKIDIYGHTSHVIIVSMKTNRGKKFSSPVDGLMRTLRSRASETFLNHVRVFIYAFTSSGLVLKTVGVNHHGPIENSSPGGDEKPRALEPEFTLQIPLIFSLALAVIFVSQDIGAEVAFVRARKLVVRDAPKVEAAKKGTLDRGQKITTLEKTSQKMTIDGLENHWYRVAVEKPKITGWVFGGYLLVVPQTLEGRLKNGPPDTDPRALSEHSRSSFHSRMRSEARIVWSLMDYLGSTEERTATKIYFENLDSTFRDSIVLQVRNNAVGLFKSSTTLLPPIAQLKQLDDVGPLEDHPSPQGLGTGWVKVQTIMGATGWVERAQLDLKIRPLSLERESDYGIIPEMEFTFPERGYDIIDGKTLTLLSLVEPIRSVGDGIKGYRTEEKGEVNYGSVVRADYFEPSPAGEWGIFRMLENVWHDDEGNSGENILPFHLSPKGKVSLFSGGAVDWRIDGRVAAISRGEDPSINYGPRETSFISQDGNCARVAGGFCQWLPNFLALLRVMDPDNGEDPDSVIFFDADKSKEIARVSMPGTLADREFSEPNDYYYIEWPTDEDGETIEISFYRKVGGSRIKKSIVTDFRGKVLKSK